MLVAELEMYNRVHHKNMTKINVNTKVVIDST